MCHCLKTVLSVSVLKGMERNRVEWTVSVLKIMAWDGMECISTPNNGMEWNRME